jgi:hypothetical protein
MFGTRFLIALAALALAAFVAAAPASPQLNLGTPLDDDGGSNPPKVGVGSGSSGGGGGGNGGGGARGGGGGAATARVFLGHTSANVHVSCIRANVLGISARVGTCQRKRYQGGNGRGDAGAGDGGAADARARSGSLGAAVGVGCIDVRLGSLGDGLKIGSCANGGTGGPPGGDDDPGDGGSGELPAAAGGGVGGADSAGSGGGGSGVGGGAAGLDPCPTSQLSGTLPFGIPPWLAGLLAIAAFCLGAFVARRRRPQAEDVAA